MTWDVWAALAFVALLAALFVTGYLCTREPRR